MLMSLTDYPQVLDFGAARDGVPNVKRGRRIVVDNEGNEMLHDDEQIMELDAANEV